ncbi:hypothetical protein D3C75_1102660 [compost metagenome]
MPPQLLAGHLPVSHGFAQQRRELEGSGGATVEQLRVQHGDAAVGQGRSRRLTVVHLASDQAEVPGRMMRRVAGQHQVRQAVDGLVQHTEVVIGPDIAVDHHKGFISQ